MALSGLDIYKLLPKTNCRECGFPTCLAFALALAKKAASLDKCPHVAQAAKDLLFAQAQPPIKLVSLGNDSNKIEIGNETVMFRHEEKFHHPTAIGIIIQDSLPDEDIIKAVKEINSLQFERIGQILKADIIAVKQTKDAERFVQAVKLISENAKLAIALISNDIKALRGGLGILKGSKTLIFAAAKENIADFISLSKEFNAAAALKEDSIDKLYDLSQKFSEDNAACDIVLSVNDTPRKALWDLTQIRRQALKKSNRRLGWPTAVIIDESNDIYKQVTRAASYIAKYAGIILLNSCKSWAMLALLTLRQNIFTDPQKPLQIEPKPYEIGSVNKNSPVIVTTNFSLTYYTVLGEVEASKIPSYILSVDTEGMSVLTAWAAEKFTPEKISESLKKFQLEEKVSHRSLIIPGYVAVLSADLEDKSGWKVVVGPKEAAGLPPFLKNL